jgi:hypothetical protein
MSKDILSVTEKILEHSGYESHLAFVKHSTVLLHLHIILSILSITKSYGIGRKGTSIFLILKKRKIEALHN